MSITLGELRDSVTRIVGQKPDDLFTIEGVINDAGRYLYGMHPWAWRDRPVYPLSYIAPISVTDATYTDATKTITKASGFTDYTYRGAELFEVTDGDNATEAQYKVSGRTSANAITLADSIGSAADGDTDIDGTLYFPYCVLPSDFGEGEIMSVVYQDSYAFKVIASSLSHVQSLRSNQQAAFDQVYYAVSYPTQTSTSVAPAQPVMEIYPTPTAAQQSVLMLSYKSGWVLLEDEDAVANVPVGYEYLLKRLAKAFAHEAMSHDNSRITEVESSVEFLKLKRMDGRTQWNLGKTQGGAAKGRPWRNYYDWNYNVNNPS